MTRRKQLWTQAQHRASATSLEYSPPSGATSILLHKTVQSLYRYDPAACVDVQYPVA